MKGDRQEKKETDPLHRFPGPAPIALAKKSQRHGKPLFPMKCPGSKCWFLPHAREFLGDWRPTTIVEPFAGSGVVGLTLLSEGYAERLVLAELDERRIAFWKRVFESDFAGFVEEWAAKALALPIEDQRQFVLDSLEDFAQNDPGMWALVYSRVSFSGKMDGGLMKKGDHGKGFKCRWRKDMIQMLRRIYELRDRIEVRHQDAMEVLEEFDRPDNYTFADPPYTASAESKGDTLYREHKLDHVALFRLMSEWKGRWQMTYDLCMETMSCGHPQDRYLILHPDSGIWKSMALKFRKVPMLTGANKKTYELVVTSRRKRAA
jgi:DNA adenine methylase